MRTLIHSLPFAYPLISFPLLFHAAAGSGDTNNNAAAIAARKATVQAQLTAAPVAQPSLAELQPVQPAAGTVDIRFEME